MGWLSLLFPGKLYIYAACALSLFGAGAYSGWQVQSWRQAKNELYGLKLQIKTGDKQAGRDDKSTDTRIKERVVYKEGQTKFVEKVIYETIQNPAPAICDRAPDSLREFNAAIDKANAAR